MIASSKKPRGRKKQLWRRQRLEMARRRSEAKRHKVRRPSKVASIHDDDRVTPAEIVAAKPEPAKAKRGLGLIGVMAAIAGILPRPLRRGAARGR